MWLPELPAIGYGPLLRHIRVLHALLLLRLGKLTQPRQGTRKGPTGTVGVQPKDAVARVRARESARSTVESCEIARAVSATCGFEDPVGSVASTKWQRAPLPRNASPRHIARCVRVGGAFLDRSGNIQFVYA